MYISLVRGWDILAVVVLCMGLAAFLIKLQSTGVLRVLRRCRTDRANAGIIAVELGYFIFACVRSTLATRWAAVAWFASAAAMAYVMIRTIQKLDREDAALAHAKASGEFKCPYCGARIGPVHTFWCPSCAEMLPAESVEAMSDAIGKPQPEVPPPSPPQPPASAK